MNKQLHFFSIETNQLIKVIPDDKKEKVFSLGLNDFEMINYKKKFLFFENDSYKNQSIITEYTQGKLKRIRFSQEEVGIIDIHSAMMDEQQRLWIGTQNGIIALDSTYKPIYTKKILPERWVCNMITDREGNIWINTVKSGTFIIPSSKILVWNSNNSDLFFKAIKYLNPSTL